MRGAIAGDVCGSVYEWHNFKTDTVGDIPLDRKDCFVTDDSVMTLAIADAYLAGDDYAKVFRVWGWRHPDVGYGGRFRQWLRNAAMGPYNSFGNGSAMRVSAVGWLFDTVEETLAEAERTALPTHNHPEGVKGAQATAAAVFLARTGKTKDEIRAFIERHFKYDLSRSIAEMRPTYTFDETCQGTMPAALRAFLESESFDHALRMAISVGGDSDTIACITGGIAEAFYGGVPPERWRFVELRLTDEMRAVLTRFDERKRPVERTER